MSALFETAKNVKLDEVKMPAALKKVLDKFGANIDKEDKQKPLTDEKISSLLKESGYLIARRTVAKYREQLDIPVARLRKKIL